MKVFLWGYMGSGKSTIGKIVASNLSIPFYDLDEQFEKQYKIEIQNFFKVYSEDAFRKLEHSILHEFATQNEYVISTGGGTPCYYDNAEFMIDCGETVYLKFEAEVLYHRLKQSRKKRPLFVNANQVESIENIKKHIESREKYYLQAQHTIISCDENAIEIANLICKKLKPEISL